MNELILQVDGISKRYREGMAYAVCRVSFDLKPGELMALVGESGSGKTTLLRIIAGLEHPDEGAIYLSGQAMVGGSKAVPPNQRGIGLLFQDYALFPHLTIFQNIAFGLHGLSKSEQALCVRDMMAVTGLEIDAGRYPHEISGGQQQRVALARALAARPRLLLLDEPFSNLDTILREQIREDVKEIIAKTRTTAILVTHDIKDALAMADRIAVMDKGRLLQIDTPGAIYHRPINAYVARLFGKFNVVDVEVEGEFLRTGFGSLLLTNDMRSRLSSRICFRPEHAQLTNPSDSSLFGIVRTCNFFGDRWQLKLEDLDNKGVCIYIDYQDSRRFSPGDRVAFTLSSFSQWEGQ